MKASKQEIVHAPRYAVALVWAGVFVTAAVWNQFRFGGPGSWTRSLTLVLIAIAIPLAVAGLAFAPRQRSAEPNKSHGSRYRWLLPVLLLLHGLLACYLIRASTPRIDCLTWQRDASASLLQGRDPYGTSHANIYSADESRQVYGPGTVVNGRVQVGLTYPPVTFLSAVPGYLLGDVRYGYVAATLLSAIFLFALFPDARGLSLSTFVLVAPTTYFLEYECWTEPLVWMLLCATVYAAVKRPRWLPLALGIFLASKQYNFLALPFIGFLVQPFSWRAYFKLLGLSLAIALATVLPFALWNFRALWYDLYIFLSIVPPRHDALSFAIPFPVYARIGPFLLMAFIVWAAWRGAQRAEMFAAAYGMALMLFFTGRQQAAVNYFCVIALAFCLTAASLWFSGKAQLPRGSEGKMERGSGADLDVAGA